MATTALKWK